MAPGGWACCCGLSGTSPCYWVWCWDAFPRESQFTYCSRQSTWVSRVNLTFHVLASSFNYLAGKYWWLWREDKTKIIWATRAICITRISARSLELIAACEKLTPKSRVNEYYIAWNQPRENAATYKVYSTVSRISSTAPDYCTRDFASSSHSCTSFVRRIKNGGRFPAWSLLETSPLHLHWLGDSEQRGIWWHWRSPRDDQHLCQGSCVCFLCHFGKAYWLTASKQFGNMLVLTATYMSSLSELMDRNTLKRLLARTICFLLQSRNISPSLRADAFICWGFTRRSSQNHRVYYLHDCRPHLSPFCMISL